jgi:hypothetical protein
MRRGPAAISEAGKLNRSPLQNRLIKCVFIIQFPRAGVNKNAGLMNRECGGKPAQTGGPATKPFPKPFPKPVEKQPPTAYNRVKA